jgi:hypothetical protein
MDRHESQSWYRGSFLKPDDVLLTTRQFSEFGLGRPCIDPFPELRVSVGEGETCRGLRATNGRTGFHAACNDAVPEAGAPFRAWSLAAAERSGRDRGRRTIEVDDCGPICFALGLPGAER